MITTEIETRLRIVIFTMVAGHTMLGSPPHEAAELTRNWLESGHLRKLNGEFAAALREAAETSLDLAVKEYTDDTQGWSRMHPDGESKVRHLRLVCYTEVGKKLLNGMPPAEIRTSMRRIASGTLDALGPSSPEARTHELTWEITTTTIDRALHIFRPGDTAD